MSVVPNEVPTPDWTVAQLTGAMLWVEWRRQIALNNLAVAREATAPELRIWREGMERYWTDQLTTIGGEQVHITQLAKGMVTDGRMGAQQLLEILGEVWTREGISTVCERIAGLTAI